MDLKDNLEINTQITRLRLCICTIFIGGKFKQEQKLFTFFKIGKFTWHKLYIVSEKSNICL
jgi:hypothetical protein